MNNQRMSLYHANGVGQVADSVKVATGEDFGLALTDALVISRILFAILALR